MTARILGLDTSLTGTGFALLECDGDTWSGTTWTRGRSGKRNEPLTERDQRLASITADLHTVDLSRLTGAGIEQPAFGAPGGSTWDRAGLWWRMVHRVLSYDVPLYEVNSSTRQKFAVGRAHSKKNPVDKADVAMAAAKMWPHVEIRGNNAADALVIASVVAVAQGLPVPFDLPKYRMESLAKLVRPENLEAA